MDKQPVFFCVCSQKGGVGKSTFTILLASWLHYALGRDVLVVDCDAPQWSIVAQRERELDVLERNDRYKLMMVRLSNARAILLVYEDPKAESAFQSRCSADYGKILNCKKINISNLLFLEI